ncbi:putative synapse-associated protein [Tripterygium wilfordii]|uniref:Putative synapse-associated protein n=1 Tax=Tripterygium wilfordii TaxID=458696 RepID=A0A7J7CF19_TRIWF|nr:BSD domain-containing protein 1-like [Tripterygium wilfordii]KAF5732738.1 putative synapse-associated protein [Tripterygium wilfordii]
MDFFKSVFSDDPDPPPAKQESDSPRNEVHQGSPDADPQRTNPDSSDSGSGAWSFGGLFKTISTKSESVLETYRRDLKEFGSGLRKEIEVAQGSLENVSHKIDEIGSNVWKETTQIISQGKDAILSADHESDSSDYNNSDRNSSNKKYSRFDAQVRAIQGDASTYCDEPEDLDDYNKWILGFDLKEKSEDMESLFEENGAMESIYKRVVPSSVDHETFWCRYYYRVYRLEQVDHLRAIMVKRATEEEDLSWDVDDEEFEEESTGLSKPNSKAKEEVGSKYSGELLKEEALQGVSSGDSNEMQEKVKPEKETNVVPEGEILENRNSEQIVKEVSVQESDKKEDDISEVDKEGKGSVDGSNNENFDDKKMNLDKSNEGDVSKSDEKVALEGKGDAGESVKDGDSSLTSAHEEEDLGWDEIEDLSSIEEKDDRKVSHGGSPNRADLRKRLSTAEDDEDLSWDIEEDDEPVKAQGYLSALV